MKTKVSNQQRITNTILLNASFINNLGLMNGKMGISIFFYHVAGKTKNKIYEDYAGELIDEIYEDITANTPVDFENGLAGIGWGIEYLVQNNFIEADTDEVLEEFDTLIHKEFEHNLPKEIGLLDGIVGIGFYFLKRFKNPQSMDEKTSTRSHKKALLSIVEKIDRRTQDVSRIIREPQYLLKGEQGNHELLFDTTWDYSALLTFLIKLHEYDLFKTKTEVIIQRLLQPLGSVLSWPKLHSNRLLLILTLNKLPQTMNFNSISSIKVLPNIEREKIESELELGDVTIKNGILGIVWIYRQLFEITKNTQYKAELDYWESQILKHNALEDNNFNVKDFYKTEEFGILKGWAGKVSTSIKME